MITGLRSPHSRRHTTACYCTDTAQCGYCRHVERPCDWEQKTPETFLQYVLRRLADDARAASS